MKRTVASRFVCVAVLTTALLSFGAATTAGEQDIDLNALIDETQNASRDDQKQTLIWWMPLEFWRASASQGAGIQLTDAQINELVDPFRPYMIFAIVDGKIGPFAGVQYESKERIHSRLRLSDEKGKRYSPLPESEISPDVLNALGMMKPVLENMLGPLGKNVHFFIFSAKDKKGRSIADATAEGSFRITLGEESFRWRLPLGSLLAPKACPDCGEKLSGAYKFCPYDGTKLSTDKKFLEIQPDDADAHHSAGNVNGNINSDLLEAAKAGDDAKVEILLEQGADANAKDKDGRTALMMAATKGRTETAKTLIEAGADVDAKTPKGTTALKFAETEGHTEVAEILKQAGARE
ncbi:MAG: ankyrin repeat domain-containing protein [Acidobacteriota bacterium]|nr:MAG: ankyrin repeat domain-containing protein [Acidobacteriota bacterium]